jgi:uncharacterized membrane protein YfhO
MEEKENVLAAAEMPVRIKKKFWERPAFLYALCFLIPVGIMYLAYALFEVHPFGDGSVLVLDLNGQYVYYYEAYRDALLGDGSLIYDWSRNLSGSMFGIFAYYLASPFMILVCIFPRTAMCGAIETIQLLKIGCSAAAFAYYVRNNSRRFPKNLSVILFSMMYALMSYMVVQLMDPMWLDGLIYLPLICHGVRRLINEGKLLPYIIPLALMFMAHFYIGYMIGFFTFCWFIACYFGEDGRLLPERCWSSLFKFAGGTVTAILAAGVVLLTVYNSLKLGKLEFTQPDWSMATQFDYLTFVTKLFPMSYDTVYPEGLPMIYCGTAVIIMLPLFFMNRHISVKHKATFGILAAVMTVFMYIRPVDIVWHGFQVPNWLPYRYSFAFSFLLVLMAFEAFENLNGVTAKELGASVFGVFVFLIWCERENYEHFEIFRSVTGSDGKARAVIGGIWFSAICTAVLFLLIYLNGRYRSVVLSIITCCAVGLELLANSMDTLQKIDKDVAYSKYTSYEPYMSNTIEAVKHIKEFDGDPFFRMEATFHRTVNDPIGTNYAGVSHSSSVMNAPALTLLKQLGYAYGGHYTKYEGTTYITDSIFGIRYLMDKYEEIRTEYTTGEVEFKESKRFMDSRTKVPLDYKLVTQSDFDHGKERAAYKFYLNPYAAGLGIVADRSIETIRLSDIDPFGNQNLLYSALDGSGVETEYFTRLTPKESDRLNIATGRVSDEYRTMKYAADDPSKEAHIDYIVEMDKDSDLYMFLPTRYERNCNIWVQDEESFQNSEGSSMTFAGCFFVGDNYSILNLGSFVKNQEVRVRVTIDNDDNEAYWCDTLFCSFDKEAFIRSATNVTANTAAITDFSNRSVTFECTAEDSTKCLFTTIPAEPGWIVTVNGEQVTPGKCADALMTVPLKVGSNTVKMTFDPSYYRLGWAMTAAGVLLIIVIFIFEYKNGAVIGKIKGTPTNKTVIPADTSAAAAGETIYPGTAAEDISSVIPDFPDETVQETPSDNSNDNDNDDQPQEKEGDSQ